MYDKESLVKKYKMELEDLADFIKNNLSSTSEDYDKAIAFTNLIKKGIATLEKVELPKEKFEFQIRTLNDRFNDLNNILNTIDKN